jgi:hypothetical protein
MKPWLLAALAACGSGGGQDASVDIDNGSCGDQLRFTGELVDWESDTAFCGIFDAKLEVVDGAMDSTAPNGRFDLCLPGNEAVTRLAVTPPAGSSMCAQPPSSYDLPMIAVANHAVIRAGGFWSGRAFTVARRATFFQAIGAAYDPAKAQVLVHVNGTPRAVSLAAAHGPAQAINVMAWAAGDTGHDVFFPNVDVGGGTTMVSVVGGAIGTGSIPLVAGTITNVSVLVQ